MKPYIQFIDYVRKKQNLTVAEFCRRIDYRRSAYYRLLKGEASPSVDVFFRMLDILEVDFKYVKREL